MTLDVLLARASLVVWSAALLYGIKPCVRIAMQKGRYLDWVWGIGFLEAANRVTFTAARVFDQAPRDLDIPRTIGYSTSIALGVGWMGLSWWYRKNDA